MTCHPEIPESWLGLCPKTPAIHSTSAVLVARPDLVHPATPKGSGPDSRSGRIRDGIGIAVASLTAPVRDRHLLWFTLLSGLIMVFLVLAEGWMNRYIDPAFPVAVLIGDLSVSVDLQYLWVAIPIGNSNFIFSFGLFLIELVCLSGFIIVLTGLILHRSGSRGRTPVTVRGGLSMVRPSFGSLAALSVGMALLATVTCELISKNQFFGSIIHSITMALFWLPYSYYEPQNWTLGAVYYSATFFALEIMVINGLLFLTTLFLVPSIVLDRRGLIPALTGSLTLFRRTWHEVLGCVLVFGFIVIGVAAAGLVIGQSPALLNHDYDFFLSQSRGYLPMMAVCYGFIIACWILMAAGFSAAGVAIADLYRVGKSDSMAGIPEGSLKIPEPLS